MGINKISTPHHNNTYKFPTFCGYSRTKLGHCIDEFISSNSPQEEKSKTLTELFQQFIEKVQMTKLGEGYRAKVYKIDDKYVLKINKNVNIPKTTLTPTQENVDLFKDLKSYFGASVMSFNDGIRVLKNVSSNGEHLPAGIKINFNSEIPLSEKITTWNTKYLPTFSNLPQKPYDDIAEEFAELNKVTKGGYSYEFDTVNPNNFVLVGDSIRIVDEVNETLTKKPNGVAGLLRVFLEMMDTDNIAPKDFMNMGMRHSLIKKIILAGEKYELPLISQQKDFTTWQCVLDETCDYRYLLGELHRYRKAYPDMNIRLEKVKQLLDDEIAYSYSSFN